MLLVYSGKEGSFFIEVFDDITSRLKRRFVFELVGL